RPPPAPGRGRNLIMTEVLRTQPGVTLAPGPLTEAREMVQTACPLDCPDACSVEVEVVDGRVERIEGTHRNPLTAGFICHKVRHYADRVYGPERLRYPGLRRGAKGEGRFERISWDAALDLVTEKVREV